MASFDIKSLSANIAKDKYSTASHNTHTTNNNQLSGKTEGSNKIIAEKAVLVQSLYMMTPDGVIHRRDGDGYDPEITLESYSRLKSLQRDIK
ncbi:MAG: hypothetical protein ACK5WS_00990 [Alphaproteobacteria bacterium]|jgi:hypothetical protein|nr:hypothetical protein [Candidatus Jidaibacter sp.]